MHHHAPCAILAWRSVRRSACQWLPARPPSGRIALPFGSYSAASTGHLRSRTVQPWTAGGACSKSRRQQTLPGRGKTLTKRHWPVMMYEQTRPCRFVHGVAERSQLTHTWKRRSDGHPCQQSLARVRVRASASCPLALTDSNTPPSRRLRYPGQIPPRRRALRMRRPWIRSGARCRHSRGATDAAATAAYW